MDDSQQELHPKPPQSDLTDYINDSNGYGLQITPIGLPNGSIHGGDCEDSALISNGDIVSSQSDAASLPSMMSSPKPRAVDSAMEDYFPILPPAKPALLPKPTNARVMAHGRHSQGAPSTQGLSRINTLVPPLPPRSPPSIEKVLHRNGSVEVKFSMQTTPSGSLQPNLAQTNSAAPDITLPDSTPSDNENRLSSSDYFKPLPTQPKGPQLPAPEQNVDYHFKLISVAFKEAALDSPSFRASVNHLDSQLLATEKWLQAIASLLVKIPKQAKELLSLFLYLEYLVPSFLQDGIVDQEYTLTALRSTRDGLQNLWSIAESALQINLPNLDSWEKNIMNRMTKYKRLRQRFERLQKKYDHFLDIHMGMLKSKNPALLLEDLQQLAIVRNGYLKVSLDLVVELSDVSQFVNRHLINFVYKIWSDKLEKLGGNPFVLALFSEVWDGIKRIHTWSEIHRKSSVKMSQDMLKAKKNIQEHAIELLAPSKLLDDYKSDLINQRLLTAIEETSTEKHGYLFMKTYTEKAKQPIWVRRWAFLQGGVLGFLVLDPSMTSVQETDKIGVLLCNVKYSPNEDRAFCFEVKTIDTTIVLQAETLYELKSWLKVFSNIGTRIVDENDPMHDLLKVASGRYPPLVLEFQSTANTTVDRDLTHAKIISSSGQVITSSKLSAHLEKNEAFFQKYIYDQIGRIFLPFVTETTRSALVAYSLTGSTVVPSALSANIWGSLNWGLYYLYEPSEEAEESRKGLEDLDNSSSVSMPKNFPNMWAARDVQLKALFESAVEPGEFCLLSYHCLLSPNPAQSLRGTHFVTQRHIYSYISSLGFISLSKIPLGRILEATITQMQDYDILKLSLILGLLKLKLFLEDSRLVDKKLNFLLKNYCSSQPLDVSELILRLLEIEEAHTQMKRKERFKLFEAPENNNPVTSLEHKNSNTDSSLHILLSTDTMSYFGEKFVDLPPQALLHVLFGSKSRLFMDLYQVMDVRLSELMPWLKAADGSLQREFEIDVVFFNGKAGRLVVSQEIEKFVENEFYSIKVRNSSFKMKYGPMFDYTMRIIIQQSHEGQSSIKFYGSTNVVASFIARIAPQYLGNTLIPLVFTEISRKIREAVKLIGTKGKISKSIYIYGHISATDTPMVKRSAQPIIIDNGVICNWCFQIKVRQVTRSISHFCWAIIGFFLNVLNKLSVHRFLIGIIFCLTLSNMFFGARSTANYWKTRQVTKLVNEILQVDPINIHRAVYSKDVEDFARNKMASSSDSLCFQIFQNQSVVLNPNKLVEWVTSQDETEEDERMRKFKRKISDIAQKRNQLLLSLATLNQMEKEIAQTEWSEWVFTETLRCDQLKQAGVFENVDEHSSKLVLHKLDSYCESCVNEVRQLNPLK